MISSDFAEKVESLSKNIYDTYTATEQRAYV